MVTKGKVLALTDNTIDLLDVSLLVILSVSCKSLLLHCITKLFSFCYISFFFLFVSLFRGDLISVFSS